MRGASTQCERDRLLNDFEIALGEQLNVDVLNGLLGSIDQHNLQEDIVVVDLSDSFSVDRIRVSSQLVDLLVVFVLEIAHEVAGVDTTLTELLSDIEITACNVLALELAELNALIRWSHSHILSLKLLVKTAAVRRKQFGV